MRGRFAHLAEVLERGDDAAAEVLLPEPVDDDPGGERVVGRGDPARQGEAPARGAPVGPRDLGGRIAARDHLHEPRLHLRAAALDVAADQEIRRRRLVASGTLVQVAAGERRRNPALRAAHHLVALAERREAMVAVGGDVGHRQRRRTLLLDGGDLREQLLSGRELGRRHRRVEVLGRHVHRLEHLDGQQLLARGPRALRLGGGLVDGVGEARLDQRQLETVAMRLLDGGDLRLEAVAPGVERLVGGQVGGGLRRRRQRHAGLDVAEDRRLQRVVVLLPDRIELVVVAARAADRQSQRALADHADDVVEVVETPLGVVLLAEQHPRPGAQEAGGDLAVVGLAVHLVAGDLLDEEPVVGHVGVERLDHVVAIAPGIGAVDVVLEAAGVGVAGHVEPVTPVAFAVVRRGQQRVDQPFPGVGPVVGDEALHFVGRRRQADQVEIGAAHQRAAVGAGRGDQPTRRARLLEEAIDGVVEAGVAHDRQRRLQRRLEGPVGALFVGDRPFLDGGDRRRRRGRHHRRRVPAGAFVDPALQRARPRRRSAPRRASAWPAPRARPRGGRSGSARRCRAPATARAHRPRCADSRVRRSSFDSFSFSP